MDLRDFIVTPLVIIGVYAFAFFLRPRLTNLDNYKYFFPALTVKIIGALALGFIYQFYYTGGDTYNYHTHGSRVIWETFLDNPAVAFEIIFSSPDLPAFYKYTSEILFYRDPSSMVVVRTAALFDLITFSSYCGTAVLFAFFSFLGQWFFFLTFYELFPHLKKRVAICALFIPSVVFWGSGILKDTIVMACLGVTTFTVKRIFIDKRFSVLVIAALITSVVIVFLVKSYILMCFIPAILFWIYAINLKMVRSVVVRIMLFPIIILIAVGSGYYAIQKLGENDERYSLDKIAKTSQVTAYDIAYLSGRGAGSFYALGELDGSFSTMLGLMPQAVNVSLFRPYPWEAKNVLMILSSAEATALLIITVMLFLFRPIRSVRSLGDPTVIFCLVFSITFAFAVGVSTFNFGTLMRYRIPLLPFYLLALVLLADGSKREKKVEAFEITE